MSLIKANAVQVGQSPTATQNFTLAVPSSPDGTIKLARGNSGATTQDVMNVSNAGVVSFPQGLGNISNSTAIATGSTTARSLANRFADVINVRDFGAVGDNSTDDSAAFQAAINYCQSGGNIQKALYIPEGAYVFNSRLIVNGTFDIRCDKTAAMRWTSQVEAQCGILFDFQNNEDSLCDIELPQLYSAGITSSFTIPGYGPTTYTYDLNARYGNGVHVKGGNRLNIYVHNLMGWHSAILLEPTSTRSIENINVEVNTIDFCVKGITIYAFAPTSGKYVGSLDYKANTVWAKYPIFFDLLNTFIVASKFAINGQVFMNEVGACGIYTANVSNNLDTCNFYLNWTGAGYGSDSTVGTPTTLICPYLGGDGSSNGQVTDGLSPDVGYFEGKFCDITIGPVMGIPGDPNCIPNAGKTIRIRDAGAYNKITILNQDSIATNPISTTTTPSESSYNGGVGGAQYSKKVYCSATIPALSPLTGTVDHYIYYQNVSSANNVPVKIYPIDTGIPDQGIQMYAAWDASSQNRRIKLGFRNPSTTRTTTAGTYFFWIEV
jgi:hypothetical protein